MYRKMAIELFMKIIIYPPAVINRLLSGYLSYLLTVGVSKLIFLVGENNSPCHWLNILLKYWCLNRRSSICLTWRLLYLIFNLFTTSKYVFLYTRVWTIGVVGWSLWCKDPPRSTFSPHQYLNTLYRFYDKVCSHVILFKIKYNIYRHATEWIKKIIFFYFYKRLTDVLVRRNPRNTYQSIN